MAGLVKMEAKKIIEHVQGINGGQTATGTLTLTDFHMIFSAVIPSPAQDEQEPAQPQKRRERWITYPMLSHCTFRPTPPSSRQASSIRIQCRDFTYITFNFTTTEIAREAYDHIKCRTCKLGTVRNLFAFSHKPPKMEREVDGWNIYDPKAEFRRQGISEKLPDKGWRITNINHDYSLCDTYPAVLVVPSKISDNVLKYAKEYRSRNRIPALTYLHPVNNCSITRSSQPLAGITRRTNVQDEKLVAASFSALTNNGSGGSEDPSPMSSQTDMFNSTVMLETQLSDKERYEDEIISKSAAIYDDKTGKRLIYGAQQNNLIVDARPTINAILNQAQGMGSEPMDKYRFAEKIFLNIDNIHIMRSSLLKVVDALKDADISPLPPNRDLLQNSNWLKHIHDILDGTAIIARQVGIKHSHVLIHCSDGWDRTSQLSALSQIMLDPYYRTIDGFIVLIEKDWLSFGYMFRLRSGHLNSEDWFTIQKDAFAGLKVQPGENDGRSDAFQNVISGAKRLFSSNKDDADLATMGETASGQVVDEEATVQKMISPVFHQFLDCMYQLLRQNPTRFEFNERFLRRLLYHLHSCQYGTFLYNSEKQRKTAEVAQQTASVWDYFLCRRPEFTNPDYDPTVDDHVKGKERIILPKLKEIRWWHQLFGRTEDEMNGALNAAAIAESDREAATSTLSYPSVVQATEVAEDPASRPASRPESRSASSAPSPQPPSPQPPSLSASQSAISPTETAHGILTPEDRQAALQHSVSADGMGAFAALRDGIAGLNISKAVLSNFGRAAEPVPEHSAAASISREQEMREMT